MAMMVCAEGPIDVTMEESSLHFEVMSLSNLL
jgi:hypothetical protein